MSINRRMEKIIYRYRHTHTHTHTQWNIILTFKKNEILAFATTWMDLESISEISQTEKDKYYMLALICEI